MNNEGLYIHSDNVGHMLTDNWEIKHFVLLYFAQNMNVAATLLMTILTDDTHLDCIAAANGQKSINSCKKERKKQRKKCSWWKWMKERSKQQKERTKDRKEKE